jgi:hypothetical protein
MAIIRRIRNKQLPDKFKPLGIVTYEGTSDPNLWLRCYSTSIQAAGGDNDTKVLHFPMALGTGPLT